MIGLGTGPLGLVDPPPTGPLALWGGRKGHMKPVTSCQCGCLKHGHGE